MVMVLVMVMLMAMVVMSMAMMAMMVMMVAMATMATMAMMVITSQFVECLVEGWGGPYHPIILSSRRDTTNKEFLLPQQKSLN